MPVYKDKERGTYYMIPNFKELGIKKLIITNFPISDEPEEWTDLLEGEKYVIEKVPSKLTDSDSYTSVTVEQFLAKHKETFKVKDNSKQAAHIKLIKAADIVIGFPSVNILLWIILMHSKCVSLRSLRQKSFVSMRHFTAVTAL